MSHDVRLLAGPKLALRPYQDAVANLRIYALLPRAAAYVLPLDDDVLDALHARNGTGEWLSEPTHAEASPPNLTTTDIAFAAKASTRSALVYLETNYFGRTGWQAAAAWIDGEIAMRPALAHTREARATKLLPINGALRLVGIVAQYTTTADDEFTAFGLTHYRSNAAIHERAIPAPD
ncbi:MAG: hypothetical protein K2Y05_10990 [Hyphomicrobiaceae bacterium]|nr:hypothetical protein [Hyphomicrobiaceae bacterium]